MISFKESNFLKYYLKLKPITSHARIIHPRRFRHSTTIVGLERTLDLANLTQGKTMPNSDKELKPFS